jgi:HAD superfamily hydrolase (TIGR01509 family)
VLGAIFFDMDGVLVDAAPWHYQAFSQALREFGFEISTEEHQRTYNGLPTRVKLHRLTAEKGLPLELHDRIHDIKQKLTRQIIEAQCQPAPAITELLTRLRGDASKLAVCSNAVRSSIDLILSRLGIARFFDLILSNEDITHPKPAPDIYLKAVLMIGMPKEQCLAIEDTDLGVQAARSAGIQVLRIHAPHELTYARIAEVAFRKQIP